MKKYEAVYILDDRRLDDHGDVFVGELTKYIESLGGNVEVAKSLGRKQLASPIRKRNTGVYWDLEMNMPEDKLAELHEHYRMNDTVLRDVVFIFDRPEITVLPRREKESSSDVDQDDDDQNDDD